MRSFVTSSSLRRGSHAFARRPCFRFLLPAALLVAAACCCLRQASGTLFNFFSVTGNDNASTIHRRRALLTVGTAGLVAGGASGSQEAHAFKNAVKKVGGVKTPGPAPGELGLLPRGEVNMQTAEDILQLKGCIAKAPNCFTTNSEIFDKGTRGIDPWKFEGKKPEVAMKEVLDVVNAYPPGQGDLKIDGGGFEVKEATDKYIYVVFESLRKGYLDDVEFAINPQKAGELYVRSGSRQGFYDMGVNAARLNWIANALTQKGGWIAPQIDGSNHPGYWKKGNCQVQAVAEKFPTYCL